jgi:hypothetical protein
MGAGHGNDDFVTLNMAQLNRVMAKDDTRAVIEAAVSGGAIDIDKHYAKGSHSRGYRLNERFKNDKIVKVKPTDRRMIDALERQRNKHQVHHKDPRTSKLIQQMTDEFYKIDVDLDLAREVISSLPEGSNPFDRQTIITEDLANKNFIVFPTRWGRFYNNISGLHSQVRTALSYRGARLRSADLKNSQPAFLGLRTHLIYQHLLPTLYRDRSTVLSHNHHLHLPSPHLLLPAHLYPDHPYPDNYLPYDSDNLVIYDSENPLSYPPDLSLFNSEVSEGRFYESFQAELNRRGVTVPTIKHARTRRNPERGDVKDGLMMHVLAKKGGYPSEFRNIFAERYPTVDAEIRRTNQSNYRNLIRELQGLEAEFVIHKVAAGALLLPSKPLVLTLHDCIITGEGETDLIEAEFERGFREIGYRMKLECDIF